MTTTSCRLGTAIGTTPATLEIVSAAAGSTIVLSSTRAGATQTSYIGYGSGGDLYIRPHASTGSVFVNDNPSGKVTIGTSSPTAGYNFTVATASIFLSDVKINGSIINNSI